MMSTIYYGEIREEKMKSWKTNDNPYEILAGNNEIHRLGGWDFLSHSKEIFDEEVQVDWGSFAYKCTKAQLERLVELTHCQIENMDNLKDEVIYGIIFIEDY